jgi:hypothetical protein
MVPRLHAGHPRAAAVDRALCSFLDAVQGEAPEELSEVIRREREQRRAAAEAKKPGIPGLLPQAACDGPVVRTPSTRSACTP